MFIHDIHHVLIPSCLKATPTSLLKSYLDRSGTLYLFGGKHKGLQFPMPMGCPRNGTRNPVAPKSDDKNGRRGVVLIQTALMMAWPSIGTSPRSRFVVSSFRFGGSF